MKTEIPCRHYILILVTMTFMYSNLNINHACLLKHERLKSDNIHIGRNKCKHPYRYGPTRETMPQRCEIQWIPAIWRRWSVLMLAARSQTLTDMYNQRSSYAKRLTENRSTANLAVFCLLCVRFTGNTFGCRCVVNYVLFVFWCVIWTSFRYGTYWYNIQPTN